MKYGCFNRLDYKPTVTVQNGYTSTKNSRMDFTIEIPFAMTTECQYTKTALGKTDPKCNNCERKEK
jgi:hypothetical protein